MKAISLHQPWATAMAIGLKRNETRNRLTHYRGDLVICSALKPMNHDRFDIMRLHNMPAAAMQFGYALCLVEVYDCVTTEFLSEGGITETEFSLGDYTPGRFAWRTRNLRRLNTPIEVKGKQGFMNLPPDVEAKILAQLGAPVSQPLNPKS